LPTDAGCLYNSAFITEAVVKDMVKSTPVVKYEKLSISYKKLTNSSVNLQNRQTAILNMLPSAVCPTCDLGVKHIPYTDPKRLYFIPGAGTTNVTHPQKDTVLSLVRAGRHVAAMSCPVGMNELSRAGQ
jgi:hypothetical protein